MSQKFITIDGNTAAAQMSFALNEVMAIYPITPSSNMAEACDEWAAKGMKNIFGTVPQVYEMQSEAGAAGAVHGALMAGALTTTFTASQGLLLMIPNMYKIAGELTPTVFQVSARAIAAQALSIFGDHQDVMATRMTGFALLASASIQEVLDLTLVAHMASLKSRVPVLHFFDGFRTSHEIQKVADIEVNQINKLIDRKLIAEFKERALSPDRPNLRGTAQNPDIYFQGRESVNKYYTAFPGILQEAFNEFAKVVGRTYHAFDYVGHPQAEVVITLMGSGCAIAEEAVAHMIKQGHKVGVIKTRLFRPFDTAAFLACMPATTKRMLVLDRTKEPGCDGEPLCLEILRTLQTRKDISVFGGRYGLGSKEFTSTQVKAAFDHFAFASKEKPIHGFTLGINDDVTHLSIAPREEIDTENDDVYRARFVGLGSDGTVGASKNTIKILGELTPNYVQGYFVYDSKKAGAVTVSHLRYSKSPILSSYLIYKPNFVSISQSTFLGKMDLLDGIQEGGTILLNSHHSKDAVFNTLPKDFQEPIIKKKLKLYIIDAHKIVEEVGMIGRINVVMQAAFFKITNVIAPELYVPALEKGIEKSYGKKGENVVTMNLAALTRGFEEVQLATVPNKITTSAPIEASNQNVPHFVKNLICPVMQQKGDSLPVSALPVDGVFETGGAAFEKRAIATHIPKWMGTGVEDSRVCIQCHLCSLVCPHASIRPVVVDEEDMKRAPATFLTQPTKDSTGKEYKHRLQVYPEDCTGCGACADTCPGVERDPKTRQATGRKALTMVHVDEIVSVEKNNLAFAETVKETPQNFISDKSVKASQFAKPYFEFSSACAGCGETPYIKLVTQLFGERLLVANATGCSSIYGGTAPAVPYCKDKNGRGPAWANSLFEDNAEFGLGMRLAVNQNASWTREVAQQLSELGQADVAAAAKAVLDLPLSGDTQKVEIVRTAVNHLNDVVKKNRSAVVAKLGEDTFTRFVGLSNYLVPKSVWIIGGDGWAYDIGFGGVDHVMGSGENVNLLVLDTQVYSNTGGQKSKATPIGAIAKFAASGKNIASKKLSTQMVNYKYAYIAQICYGSNPTQAVKAIAEAESFNGPSLVIAYAPCIEHGIDMGKTATQMKMAVDSGFWPLFRYDPRRLGTAEGPLKIDSKEPALDVAEFMGSENRFRSLKKSNPERFEQLMKLAKDDVALQWKYLKMIETNFKN